MGKKKEEPASIEEMEKKVDVRKRVGEET